MFCIYSFDFIKKNTDPQLKMFTPSKFLSTFSSTCSIFYNFYSLGGDLSTPLIGLSPTAKTFLARCFILKCSTS